DVVDGVAGAQRQRIGERYAVGDVAAQRVVGGRLVGDEVRPPATRDQLWQDVGGVGHQRHRSTDALAAPAVHQGDRVIQRVRELVDVAGLLAASCPRLVDL